MSVTSIKNTIAPLKDFRLPVRLLERLEARIEKGISPDRLPEVKARLEAVSERLGAIKLPEGPTGRRLARNIQSTLDDFSARLELTTKTASFVPPSFDQPVFFGGSLPSRKSGRGAFGLDLMQSMKGCGCAACCTVGKRTRGVSPMRKPSAFNTVGGNDQFGQNYGKWSQPGGKGTAVDITYSFKKDFDAPGLSLDKAKSLFREALQSWADYAPLNFREIADPGNGNQVDIQVGDKFIDGRSGTLAFAYFPKGGDITFDNGENWREALYLETAVHEIGHSLGLGHENGTAAIMNSSIKNRFSDKAFLLQDDINGIRNIYGSGKGSVRSLGQSPTPSPTPAPKPTPSPTPSPRKNLIANGSFENSSVGNNQFGVFNRIQGWRTYDGSGIQVDRRDQFGGAADGDAWVELDSYSNSTMYQQVDTLLGEDYTLSFKYSPRQGLSAQTNQIRVYWGDRWIDTVTKAGGSKNQWETFSYDVKGKGDKSLLAFRAVGTDDQLGGFIDDVVLTQGAAAQADSTGDPFGSDRSKNALFAVADPTFAGSANAA